MAKIKRISGTNIPSMTNAAGISARVVGLRTVAANINKQLAKIQGASYAGLIEAAYYVRKDMDVTAPLIPIDTGALRGSWFIEKHPQSTPINPVIIAGFGVNYAAYVHEMTTPPYNEVNWSRPESGPKFLEYSLKRNAQEVLLIVGKNVRKVN